MSTKRAQAIRGPQILNLLLQHGPLSHKALLEIMEPSISLRRLQVATKRLREKGLIHRRERGLPENVGHLFELSQTKESIAVLSDILDINAERLKPGFFRSQDLLHSQDCALWFEFLKRILPDAAIVRDIHFPYNKWVYEVLRITRDHRDGVPDILVRLPTDHARKFIHIIFEIERTRKADKRLIYKLNGLSNPPRVDGVVYVCENAFVEKAIRDIFLEKSLPRARFIKHYGMNFLVFARRAPARESNDTSIFNAEQKHLSLCAWLNYLREVEPSARSSSADLLGAPLRSQ
ncbi:MAG: hypothetical protein K2X47_08430 [Bdellovibrionales bacterium]|nr:hypothetical protein [Bdellovibrionales bacterium]